MPESAVRRAAAALLVPGGAVLLTLALAGAGLVAGGYDPAAAGAAMLRGTVGSVDAFTSVTLVRSVPLVLAGLGVALAFRGGVWNIGAEGQLYAGAVAATWVGLVGAGLPAAVLLPVGVLAAAAAGALWALLPMVMRVRLGVGEVIPTILMNFVALHATGFLVRGPLQEGRGVFPQSPPIAEAAHLPLLVPGGRLHAGFLLAVVLAGGLWAVLRWTDAGFQLRAVGAAARAAGVAGRIDSGRVIARTFLASGALAGLAGGIEVMGVTHALYESLSPGWGYTAIGVALLGGLHPGGVVLTGVFFAALEGGAGAMQRSAGIPAVWVIAVEACVILSVLALDRVARRGVGTANG